MCVSLWFCTFSLFLVSTQPLREKETWQVLNVEVHTSQRLFLWNKLYFSKTDDSMESFQCSSCSQRFCSAQLVRNVDAIRHRTGVWMNWMEVEITGQINNRGATGFCRLKSVFIAWEFRDWETNSSPTPQVSCQFAWIKKGTKITPHILENILLLEERHLSILLITVTLLPSLALFTAPVIVVSNCLTQQCECAKLTWKECALLPF